MRYAVLKKIRTAVSLLFFFSILTIFIDIHGIIPSGVFEKITFLQFIPSLLSFILTPGFAASGFIIMLIITAAAGRIYCSSVCPLGTFQDIIIYTGRLIRKKRTYTQARRYKLLRYIILSATVILALTGNMLLVILLDPYSNIGRIFTGIVRPAFTWLNNAAAGILESFNVYFLYPQKFKGLNIAEITAAGIFLTVIILLSLKKERVLCNTICPAGALLGIAARFSFIKIHIEKESCTGCGLCEKVCKSGCIDKKTKSIDFERCVACYNCFTVCPKEGIIFAHQKNMIPFSGSKRNFFKSAGIYFAALNSLSIAQNKIIPKKSSKVPEKKTVPVIPPGAVSLNHFNSFCTACHLCISACPTGVLTASSFEYGIAGMLQPVMDYHKSFCNFECNLCLDICPSDAITKLPLERKKLTQIGKAVFIKENCIVETEKKDCGACSEHCPTKAVTMVPVAATNIMIPELNNDYCIGCGACEFACPTKPYKAIYVNGNREHLTAKKNKSQKIEQKIDYKEEFPF